MAGRIIIENYDPGWPDQFETLRAKIAFALGEIAPAIEHVGSTAVPGLAAKPIIDIDVVLRSFADLPQVISKLAALGYEHQGDLGVPGREAFRAPTHDIPHHLYVCDPSGQEYKRHLAFRDYLRLHPEDARAYARLKRQLAETFAGDREAYTQAKSDFIAGILRRASHDSTPFRH